MGEGGMKVLVTMVMDSALKDFPKSHSTLYDTTEKVRCQVAEALPGAEALSVQFVKEDGTFGPSSATVSRDNVVNHLLERLDT